MYLSASIDRAIAVFQIIPPPPVHVACAQFPDYVIIEMATFLGLAASGGDQHKSKQNQKIKQRQSAIEGKSKEMMPSSDLPNNGNVWQTTEPMKLESATTPVMDICHIFTHGVSTDISHGRIRVAVDVNFVEMAGSSEVLTH